MSPEPFWISADEVIAINRAIVAVTGETHLVLSLEKLEGALVRPRHLFLYEGEADVVMLAAKLMIAISVAHAFEQGNKRTGWLSGVQFLNANGFDIVLPESRHKELMAMNLQLVITHNNTVEQFSQSLDRFVIDL